MSRERLLPDDKTLEKVARYEAHLSRGLYKVLHELEALQARRTGITRRPGSSPTTPERWASLNWDSTHAGWRRSTRWDRSDRYNPDTMLRTMKKFYTIMNYD
jgi:hypothetical protein